MSDEQVVDNRLTFLDGGHETRCFASPETSRSSRSDLAGHLMAAGSLIIVPIFAIRRHRRLWANPDSFDPDRFSPERDSQYSRYQFMPVRLAPGREYALQVPSP
jgi:cytochrome P450